MSWPMPAGRISKANVCINLNDVEIMNESDEDFEDDDFDFAEPPTHDEDIETDEPPRRWWLPWR